MYDLLHTKCKSLTIWKYSYKESGSRPSIILWYFIGKACDVNNIG